MKRSAVSFAIALAATLMGAVALATTCTHAEDINTRIGTLSFTHDSPTATRPSRPSRSFSTNATSSVPPSSTCGRCRWCRSVNWSRS